MKKLTSLYVFAPVATMASLQPSIATEKEVSSGESKQFSCLSQDRGNFAGEGIGQDRDIP